MAAATRMVPRTDSKLAGSIGAGCFNLPVSRYYSEPAGTNGESSGLPFVQLLLCATSENVNGSAPFGSVAYFDPSIGACPTDWTPFEDAAGLALVSSSLLLLIQIGRILVPGYNEEEPVPSPSAPLENLEDRGHNHAFETTITTVCRFMSLSLLNPPRPTLTLSESLDVATPAPPRTPRTLSTGTQRTLHLRSPTCSF